ncbi:MAG: MATE family efflux transporter [Eubacterium sp.]|nr:MATE family efflux transporter [Eubacterium sp.]
MDLLNGKIKKIYFKYLAAAFGSTLIMSIYSLVDTIAIGHYEGPNGTAAVATFFPMWSILFAFGLWFGIGGSVLMAQMRGAGKKEIGDEYFTVALLGSIVISIIIFVAYVLFSEPLLRFCGADGEVLTLAMKYAKWISLFSPLFIIGQVLVPFIRNDEAPVHTTIAVIAGGIFNIFGDIFFVFICDMGISGAGLATALGQAISFIILLFYFFTSKNTIRLVFDVKKLKIAKKTKEIAIMGLSNFVVDIAIGVLSVMFNNQIMKYLGASALAVYGVVSNVSTTVQTFAYSIGESAQAIISVNFGAKKMNRVKETFKYATVSACVLGVICFIIGESIPTLLVNAFMKTTPEVLSIAPQILRLYFISFIFLVFNVFSTYYFQSIAKPNISTTVSLMRGIIVSGICIYVFPLIFSANAIWLAIPLTELFVCFFIIVNIIKYKPQNTFINK